MPYFCAGAALRNSEGEAGFTGDGEGLGGAAAFAVGFAATGAAVMGTAAGGANTGPGFAGSICFAIGWAAEATFLSLPARAATTVVVVATGAAFDLTDVTRRRLSSFPVEAVFPEDDGVVIVGAMQTRGSPMRRLNVDHA